MLRVAIVLLLVGGSSGLAIKSTEGASVEILEAQKKALEDRVEKLESTLSRLEGALTESGDWNHDKDASRVPSVIMPDGTMKPRSFADRLHYLERKTNGQANWISDVRLYEQAPQYNCMNSTDLGTHGDHHVCLDAWEKKHAGKPCVVYDLGIRANPEFGYNLATKYGCKVRAYDPSDTSKKWWSGENGENRDQSQQLKLLGADHYDFQPFAAAGMDGPLELFEYNWQQVSIVKGEIDLTRPDAERYPNQQSFGIQAKTLPTMMKDHGDTHIDFLKVDIEGSEYTVLQDVFDRMGCPPASQITLEWHNFDFDERYGSSPQLNTIHNLLNACGFKSFYTRPHWRNIVTDKKYDAFNLPPTRFGLTSFCRDCTGDEKEQENFRQLPQRTRHVRRLRALPHRKQPEH